jgi:hypothetical protein
MNTGRSQSETNEAAKPFGFAASHGHSFTIEPNDMSPIADACFCLCACRIGLSTKSASSADAAASLGVALPGFLAIKH